MTFTRKELEILQYGLERVTYDKHSSEQAKKQAMSLYNRISPEVARLGAEERQQEIGRGFLCIVYGCTNSVPDHGQRCIKHRGIHA